MKPPENDEELSYEEIYEEVNHDFDLLYDEVHRKVESQVELNRRIEDHARSRVKTIFILTGVLISSASLIISIAASNNINILGVISNSINETYYSLLSARFIGGSAASFLTGSLFIFSVGCLGVAFGQLFLVSLYYNLSAARTSLVSSSATSSRLQDSIHDKSNMKRPKKCILYDYADTIALNNKILNKKWVDKEVGDEFMIRSFVNSFLLLLTVQIAFIVRYPLLILAVFSLAILYTGYRLAKILGYIEDKSILDLVGEYVS